MQQSDSEWQRVVKQMTTNDSVWYNEWQRVRASERMSTTIGTTIEYSESNENNERVQPVATNERK